MKDLYGQTVIMIGGTGGMGRATANLIAKPGVKICVCGKSQERLDEMEPEITAKGATVFFKAVDVAKPAETRAFIDDCYEKFGAPDILINFAGLSLNANIDTITEEQWDTIFDVNVKGICFATQAFAEKVDPSKGALVISFGSMASKRPTGGGNLAYVSAKAAVNTLDIILADQLKAKNIKFTVMNPGPTATTFFAGRKTADQMSGFMTAADIAEILEFIMVRSDRLVFHDVMVDSYAFFNK